MTRTLSLAAAALLLVAGLAGCLGSGEDASGAAGEPVEQTETGDPAAPSSVTDDDEAPGEVGQQALTYAAEPVDTTLWENGSFAATDGCLGAGCVTGDAYHQVELASELPDEAPVVVRAELTYEATSAVFGDPVSLSLIPYDATVYGYESSGGDGEQTIETTLLKGSDAVVVQVFNGGPVEGETEIQYTLRIDIRTPVDVVPSGASVAIPLEPGETLVAEAAAGAENETEGPLRVLAYGPKDRFLDTYEADGDRTAIDIPSAGSTGEHVLVVPQSSPAVRLVPNASAADLRALAHTVTTGEWHPVEGQDEVAWSFDVAERPLAVGIGHRYEEPMAATSDQGQATITGPEGPLLESEVGCGFCLGSSFQYYDATAIGEPGVAAGSYDASYQPTGEARTSVTELVVTYER